MPPDPTEIARRVLAANRKLQKIRDRIIAGRAREDVGHYNGVVDTLHACFSIDPSFSNAIKHIEPLREDLPDIASQMESDGRTLSETARRFIGLYLSTEGKES
jgi:hypothetical protein